MTRAFTQSRSPHAPCGAFITQPVVIPRRTRTGRAGYATV